MQIMFLEFRSYFDPCCVIIRLGGEQQLYERPFNMLPLRAAAKQLEKERYEGESLLRGMKCKWLISLRGDLRGCWVTIHMGMIDKENQSGVHCNHVNYFARVYRFYLFTSILLMLASSYIFQEAASQDCN